MANDDRINADRFLGFADVYDSARPKCPEKVKEIILGYLGRNPSVVVDLGCGTGLSTTIWSDQSDQVIGIEPSADMLRVAAEKATYFPNVSFLSGFSDHTSLADNSCDIVTCSQSFHWMNPETTLREVSRILRTGGVFAAYDSDWPPVCKWAAELAYDNLFKKVSEIESRRPEKQQNFMKFDKDKHLSNMQNSGIFRYQREIVFANTETCDARRFIDIALSQGGLQSIVLTDREEILPYLQTFEESVNEIFGTAVSRIEFCYRMRIGVK